MAKIYLIYNTKNNKKYVGETTNCVSQRFCQHIDAAFRNSKKRKTDFYSDIKASGENVFNDFKYKILEECADEDRELKEIEYIKKIKPEYNENYKHYYLASKPKEIVEAYNSGMTITQIRQKYRCRHDFIANILKTNNVKLQKRNQLSKKVFLFDENGKVIKSWINAGNCGVELKIDRGNIRYCCLKNTKNNIIYYSANGYHFKYDKETPKDLYSIIDKSGKEIRFKSKEALVNFFEEKFPNKNIMFGQLVRDRKTVYGYKIQKLCEINN